MNVERRRLLYVFCFSLVAVAVCYANSLPNDFILDDYLIVNLNSAIRTITPVHDLMTPFWGEKTQMGIYRPLVILSFSLEYPFWHRWPGGYRMVNLLIHSVNGLLVYMLAQSLVASPAAAWAAAAVYVLHPAHTEAVAGIAGRSELLAGMFFFLAWLLFRSNRTILAAVVFFFSLLSKENAIMFPAVMVIETWIKSGSFRKTVIQWRRFAALAISTMAYLGLRLWVLGTLGMPKAAQYLSGRWTLSERELTSGRAYLSYFRLLFAPVTVTGDYDFNSIPLANARDWDAWLGLVLISASIVFAIKVLKKQPAAGFGILFFYTTLFPVSNWIVPTGLIMAERYLYVPLFGFALVMGTVWSKIHSREVRTILAAGAAAIAVLLCISHNYIWRGDFGFYQNMVKVFPDNVRARQGYGIALLEVGQAEEARRQFVAGLQVARNPALLTGLAEAAIRIDGNCGSARPLLNEALQMANDYFARWTLARCLEREGDLTAAEAEYRRAVSEAQFPDPELIAGWGRILDRTGRREEALEAYRRASLIVR
jgi:tetratricopeptide (TPR) repeat protein